MPLRPMLLQSQLRKHPIQSTGCRARPRRDSVDFTAKADAAAGSRHSDSTDKRSWHLQRAALMPTAESVGRSAWTQQGVPESAHYRRKIPRAPVAFDRQGAFA
eukprot:4332617-Amphidinium_carterae.1